MQNFLASNLKPISLYQTAYLFRIISYSLLSQLIFYYSNIKIYYFFENLMIFRAYSLYSFFFFLFLVYVPQERLRHFLPQVLSTFKYMTNFYFPERVSSYYRFIINPFPTTTVFLQRGICFLFNLCAFYVFCTLCVPSTFKILYVYLSFLIMCQFLQRLYIFYSYLGPQCLEHCLVCNRY